MENIFINITDPKTIFLLCGLFILADIITGYLKAFKFKKVNSSISRDGYIKKIGWAVALLIGYLIDLFAQTDIFLITSALVCIATEGISFYENLGEIGINVPLKQYFEKLQDKKE